MASIVAGLATLYNCQRAASHEIFLLAKNLMQPLQFEPILKRIRWGGRRLGTVLGKSIGDGSDYAESWEIADCGADQSTVLDGPLRGQHLAQLISEQAPLSWAVTKRPVPISAIDQVSRCQRSPVRAGPSQ